MKSQPILFWSYKISAFYKFSNLQFWPFSSSSKLLSFLKFQDAWDKKKLNYPKLNCKDAYWGVKINMMTDNWYNNFLKHSDFFNRRFTSTEKSITAVIFFYEDIAHIELMQFGHSCIFAFLHKLYGPVGQTKEIRSHRSRDSWTVYFLSFIPETIP